MVDCSFGNTKTRRCLSIGHITVGLLLICLGVWRYFRIKLWTWANLCFLNFWVGAWMFLLGVVGGSGSFAETPMCCPYVCLPQCYAFASMVGGVLVTAAAASPKGYWPEGNYPDPDSDPYPEEKAFYTIMLTLGIAGLLLGILAAILSCGCFSAVISCKCCFESLTEQQVSFTVNTALASANPLPRQFQMPPPYEPGQNTLQNDQVHSEPSQNVLLVALSSDDSLHRVEVPPPPYEYDEDTPRNEQGHSQTLQAGSSEHIIRVDQVELPPPYEHVQS